MQSEIGEQRKKRGELPMDNKVVAEPYLFAARFRRSVSRCQRNFPSFCAKLMMERGVSERKVGRLETQRERVRECERQEYRPRPTCG